MNGNFHSREVIARAIRSSIIRPGDDLKGIFMEALENATLGDIQNGDIFALTESAVAYGQNNAVSFLEIAEDVERKFNNPKKLAIVNPIQSRNRFYSILKAIAMTPSIEKLYVVMTYPTDEVGNRLVSDLAIMKSGVNPYADCLTPEEFYEKLGVPAHIFTGKNYIEMYQQVCLDKIEVLMCNDFSKLPSVCGCEDFLVCSIHSREQTKTILQEAGAKRVLDMSEIVNTPTETGVGYNEIYGLYGSNKMGEDHLKLMPRDCEALVYDIQKAIFDKYGKHVEVMVYGDGCFKDPKGGIWELADPEPCLAATDGLRGTPKEVKLKDLVAMHKDKTTEEIEQIVAEEAAKRRQTEEIAGAASLGTTPRPLTALLASLADLMSGSGDRQTPFIHIRNYL